MSELEPRTPPYLSAAFFCERVMIEMDGVMSAIRIADRINAQSSGKLDPENLPPIPVSTHLVVSLKSGDLVGNGMVKVQGRKPSGQPLQPEIAEAAVVFSGGDTGGAAIFQMQLQVNEQGIYWFDIFFDDRWLTRIPLSVHVTSMESLTSE